MNDQLNDEMRYDAVIVGGGIAGLTSAAYLARSGYKILLCEKEAHVGGLVSSFCHEGFLYDAGVRGIIDSGIVKPMLEQLELEVEFVKSVVTIGIADEMMRVETRASLNDYQAMLVRLYPDAREDIGVIMAEIRKIMTYMDVLYGIENPLFKDLKHDREYVVKTLLPWLVKFLAQAGKIKDFKAPVGDFLGQLTSNQSLIDIISQHFFQNTPASFALSYFSLYLDYEYPIKGTYDLIEKMSDYIKAAGGTIKTATAIQTIDCATQTIFDQDNQPYAYEQLIWAADLKRLYQALDMDTIKDSAVKKAVAAKQQLLRGKRGGDSIYSLFLAVDIDPDYFREKASGHLFYTPDKRGQSTVFAQLASVSAETDRKAIFKWMNDYLDYTTYEIAIPSLRNAALAPPGKTGLVVSVLMDYDFISNIKALGFYAEFKEFAAAKIISVLDDSIYAGLKASVIHHFSSTPLTIARLSGNLDGAITGWAFTNEENPALSKFTAIKKACHTPVPHILQAGQWTFSPAGLPVSILTGKIAADQARQSLKKKTKQSK